MDHTNSSDLSGNETLHDPRGGTRHNITVGDSPITIISVAKDNSESVHGGVEHTYPANVPVSLDFGCTYIKITGSNIGGEIKSYKV